MKREHYSNAGLILLAILVAGALFWQTRMGSYPLLNEPGTAVALTSMKGDPLPFEDQFGKQVVVLNFWASWCPPCMQELPEIARLAEELKGKPIAVYSVATEQEVAVIESAIANMNPKPPVAMDPMGHALSAYQVSGIPCTVLLDKAGIIRGAWVGYTSSTIDEIRAMALELSAA